MHFRRRLAERGLLWIDALSVFDRPTELRGDGFDDWGRERWIVSGDAVTGDALSLVCAIGRNAAGELTVFVTIYWKGRP